MSVLIKVSAIWPLLKREVHQENLINYGKTTGRYVTISNSQSARRALWASSPQPIWAVAAGNRILRQRCWHKKSRKCISLQDHVNLYQDIKVLTSYCSIIGKPISGQDKSDKFPKEVCHTVKVSRDSCAVWYEIPAYVSFSCHTVKVLLVLFAVW